MLPEDRFFQKYRSVLSKCPLFLGIDPLEQPRIIECLKGRTLNVPKGNAIFLEGDPARFVGVVLAGAVQVIREDYYGKRSVLGVLLPGELFAEAFACAGLETLPVSAVAKKDSEVLLLDCRHVMTSCTKACYFHGLLIRNLLQEIAQKNLVLAQKIRYMSEKTTKEKLMAYLLDQAKKQGREEFIIPYDRQSLADYLGVERSAMSAEIGKLKKDGVIDTKGAWFLLN